MTDKRKQTNENMVKDEALENVNGGLLITPKTNALSDDALDQVTGGGRMTAFTNQPNSKRR